DYVKDFIPKVSPRLHVPPFVIERLEVKLRAYLDGHFFRLHMDCPQRTPENVNRRVSFVYFFHKQPRAYTGGDLLLFNTDVENDRFTTSAFTRVQPEDNCIVFFPSAYYHSVVPVSCPSKEYANSRFVINGHVSRRADPKQAEEQQPTQETALNAS